jgi:hypothetical protein
VPVFLLNTRKRVSQVHVDAIAHMHTLCRSHPMPVQLFHPYLRLAYLERASPFSPSFSLRLPSPSLARHSLVINHSPLSFSSPAISPPPAPSPSFFGRQIAAASWLRASS